MAGLFGLGTTKKRRSSSGGGKMLDTVLAVGALGAIGIVGYFVLKSGKGVEEGLDTAGDAAKGFIDAANATGEAIGNASCHIQKLFKPSLNCGEGYSISRRSGGKRDEEDDIISNVKGDIDRRKEKYAQDWGPLAKAIDSSGEFLGNKFCHAQKIFNPSLRCG